MEREDVRVCSRWPEKVSLQSAPRNKKTGIRAYSECKAAFLSVEDVERVSFGSGRAWEHR